MAGDETLYSINLPYATFGIVAVQGIVIEAAPIARWSIGKSIADVQSWVAGKGGTVYQHEVDIDWTPRPPTSRVPIFCEVCRKQGRVDRERQTITGAVMPLLDFLADKPHVCTRCKSKVSIVRAKP